MDLDVTLNHLDLNMECVLSDLTVLLKSDMRLIKINTEIH